MTPWIKSIINHFWWCCASCKGDPKELKEKWVSILHHITDRHDWEGSDIYTKCQHKKLTKKERACKPFLKQTSLAYKALASVVLDKSLLSDLKYLANFKHTGVLEVFHSLYNKYCPKRLHFSYRGMIARLQLAILDFNSGVGLNQATTSNQQLRYKQQFSKVTQSWVIKKIKLPKDKVYMDHLLDEIKYMQETRDKYPTPKLNNVPSNIALTEKPDKTDSIENMKSRFSI